MKQAGLFVFVAPLAFISFCADVGVNFDVENKTDVPLTVWAFYENCNESPGYQEDYFIELPVPPGSTVSYAWDSRPPPDEVECVQAADSSRRLVLSEPYERLKTYIVSDATWISPEPVPKVDELPHQSWWDRQKEDAREDPSGFWFSLGLAVIIVTSIAIAAGFTAVRGIRHLRSKRSQ